MTEAINPWNAYGGSPEAFVRHVRKQLQLSGKPQAALARAMSAAEPDVSRWLNLRVRPSLETVVRMDMALTDLLYG